MPMRRKPERIAIKWPYELVDAETNMVTYDEREFSPGEAPSSKPFDIEVDGEDVRVQWHPMLP